MRLDELLEIAESDFSEVMNEEFISQLTPSDFEIVFLNIKNKTNAEKFKNKLIKDGFFDKKIANKKKLEGFTFQSKKYSTTKDDQDGLTAVITAINAKLTKSIDFKFSNGEVLTLNADNLENFCKKFFSFRQKFFITNEGQK